MTNYGDILGSNKTAQNKPINTNQIKNDAGGYVFKADMWVTLDRFLIMGIPGNTFYVSQKNLVVTHVHVLTDCIKEDGIRCVNRVIELSASGRVVKADAPIFMFALIQKYGDLSTRQYAYDRTYILCNTFYKLTKLISERKGLGLGWSRGLRRAIALWYENKGLPYLIYQALKYPNRNGMSQRQLIRLAHIPRSGDPARDLVYDWLASSKKETRHGHMNSEELAQELWRLYGLGQAYARDLLHATPTVEQAIKGINGEGFTHEMIPTHLLKEKKVWEALVESMPFTATVRNLNRLSSLKVIDPLSGNETIVNRLTNKSHVQLSNIHPISLLIARKVYQSGEGLKGKLNWVPSSWIVTALENAFYHAMNTWPSTGKRLLIGVDISSSMNSVNVSNDIPFKPSELAGALACVLAHIEPSSLIMGFTQKFEPLDINSNTSLADAMKEANNYHNMMGATDCAMPMMYALGFDANQHIQFNRIIVDDYIKSEREPLLVDAFIILTDNETWIGKIHPQQALDTYRKQVNQNAKLVVVAMQPSRNTITIADPEDPLSLDIVGFDASVPQLIQDFVTNDN